jgi:hypothetical protein
MKNYKMTDVYTGGGCDHLLIEFEGYSIFFIVNNNDCNIPKNGEDWGFCSYLSEEDMNNGNYLDCIGPLENFSFAYLKPFLQGYFVTKGIKKDFNLEDVDFMLLSTDMANNCDSDIIINAIYEKLIKFSKTELIEYMGNTFGDGALINLSSYIKGKK